MSVFIERHYYASSDVKPVPTGEGQSGITKPGMNKKTKLRKKRAPTATQNPPAHVHKMVEKYKLRSKSLPNRQEINETAARILRQATKE